MERYLIENGKVWSPVLGCWAEVSLPMRRLINALNEHGDVDTIRDGGTVGTAVALMGRGILREATPRSHGKGSGHHYPATTPAQVWDDAHTMQAEREATLDAIVAQVDAEIDAEGVDTWQDPEDGYGPSFFAADGSLVEPEAEEWGQPEGMLSPVPQDRSADGVPEVEQERCIGLPAVPRCGTFAAHYPHPIGESIRYRRFTDAPEPLTPAEDRTGSDIADEIAELREVVDSIGRITDSLARHLISQHVKRIAALVPQRATDGSGRGVWQHTCGNVKALDDDPIEGQHERGCSWCYKPGAWQALYTVTGR